MLTILHIAGNPFLFLEKLISLSWKAWEYECLQIIASYEIFRFVSHTFYCGQYKRLQCLPVGKGQKSKALLIYRNNVFTCPIRHDDSGTIEVCLRQVEIRHARIAQNCKVSHVIFVEGAFHLQTVNGAYVAFQTAIGYIRESSVIHMSVAIVSFYIRYCWLERHSQFLCQLALLCTRIHYGVTTSLHGRLDVAAVRLPVFILAICLHAAVRHIDDEVGGASLERIGTQ